MNFFGSFKSVEKRRATRRKTFLGGDIISGDNTPSTYCLVRDLSLNGCMLSVEKNTNIPDEFLLELSNGEEKYCTIVWRSGHRIGVEFL
ncbi:MAG: PilZ domain-containing protein [Pseudomonadota bacterium]